MAQDAGDSGARVAPCALRAAGARVLGPGAVQAAWDDREGRIELVLNLGGEDLALPVADTPDGQYRSDGGAGADRLPPDTCLLRWWGAA